METKETQVYEVAFHIDPNLSETEVKATYEKVKKLVGGVIAEGSPKKTDLAYTISRREEDGRNDFDSAFFAWVAYEGSPEGQEAIDETLRATKEIVRYLVVKTTREAVEHAEQQALMRREEAAALVSLEDPTQDEPIEGEEPTVPEL